MILVAGLAVAGLAGIAAAFYFSMRPGRSRVRTAAAPGPAAGSRVSASRSRISPSSSDRPDRSAGPARSARSDRSVWPDRSDVAPASAGSARSESGRATDRTGASVVIDFTGPQPVLEESEPPVPVPVSGRRARHGDRPDDAPGEPTLSRRAAARHLAEADTDDAAKTARSRRRVGWRKGTDVDEEMWPAATFGGVSDEQFWDDMAADKPLATTARTAPAETAARRRPNAGPLPDLRPAASPLPDLRPAASPLPDLRPAASPLPDLRPAASPLPDLRPGDDRSREDGRRAAAEGPGTHPQPRLGPDDRTAIQPTTQPAVQPAVTAPTATQPYPTATQPSPSATQPVRAAQPDRAQQPAGSRGRSRAAISADEDPLTSPAYSLRAKGSVDGRSRRPRDLSREQYPAAGMQETQTFNTADAQPTGGGYPDGVPPFRQFDRPAHHMNGRGRSDPPRSGQYRSEPLRSDHPRSDPLRSGDGYRGTVPNTAYPYPQQPYGEPTSSMNTPPYGERYGYGNPVDQADQASPAADLRRANGGRRPGQSDGNGAGDRNRTSRPGYPQANGYRGPSDPQGYDRQLTSWR